MPDFSHHRDWILPPRHRKKLPSRSSLKFSAYLVAPRANHYAKERLESIKRTKPPPSLSAMPECAAIILAAGESSRFGKPKQLIEIAGKPLVRRIVDAAAEANCRPIIVVAGTHEPAL